MKPFEYKTYSREGIYINYSEATDDADYMKVAHQFLRSLMKEFAALSMKSFRPRIGADNLPYMYTERRLDSVVLPALSNICDGVVLTELPVKRKKANNHVKSEHGRLDYWCVYKGYTFAIEMKGTHARFDCDTVRENSVLKRWDKMIEQLKDVKSDCEKMTENTKGIIRLGLHFVSSWSPCEPNEEEVEKYRRGIKADLGRFCDKISERFNDDIEHNPSFAAAWVIPDDMVYWWIDVTYPGVMLFAKVLEPLEHKR